MQIKLGKHSLGDVTTRLALWRLGRAVPVIGLAFAAWRISSNVRRKGLTWGAVDSALDLMPVVGRVKAVYELFRGEIIAPPPGRAERRGPGIAFTSGLSEAPRRRS